MEEDGQLREENRRLKGAVEELSILNEVAAAIGLLNNSEEVVRKILSRALGALNAEQGVVTLLKEFSWFTTKGTVRNLRGTTNGFCP